VELKTGKTGDGVSSGRRAIDQAVTQVMTGVGGLAEHMRSRSLEQNRSLIARFIPAVFTTAEIWSTAQDISMAELASGHFKEPIQPAVREDWLWLNYNVSPTLHHSIALGSRNPDLAKALQIEFTRTVAVVSPSGIHSFLSKDFSTWL
jgi:hypothetical protein